MFPKRQTTDDRQQITDRQKAEGIRHKAKGNEQSLSFILHPSSLISKRGVAMVEVIVAIIVAALTTMAIFSVILSALISQRKADKREAAAMVIQKTVEKLKSYVTVTTSLPTDFKIPSDSLWRLSGDSYTGWALAGSAAGVTHDVASLLPASLEKGGTFSYTVFNEDCGFGTGDYVSCKKVVFNLQIPDDTP